MGFDALIIIGNLYRRQDVRICDMSIKQSYSRISICLTVCQGEALNCSRMLRVGLCSGIVVPSQVAPEA